MEKVLKLYTYIDGVNDTPFPNKDEQVITSDFRSDYKRMGGVPTISCTIMHPLCLDKLWTDNVYATFNGEKFFIKQIPTSSYDNTDARYKHELELVSERIILDNVYVYDVVTSDTTNDKPVSNSSKFVFFGTIHEFAERLNYSLQYSGLDYRVVVDDGISSEGKMVSFENQFFSNAIQEAYNTYEIPYYFVGKVIHIGFTNNAITKTFKYGQDESLLSIQKQNANYKIVNRVTGVGSADNIPYYYPNDDEKGQTNLLYNGKSGVATISNKVRFEKVKLGDTFVYQYIAGGKTFLYSWEEYNFGRFYYLYAETDTDAWGETVYTGRHIYELTFSYSFPIDVYKLVDFTFYKYQLGYPADGDIIDFSVELREDFRGLIDIYRQSSNAYLGQGNYVLKVRALIAFDTYEYSENDFELIKEIIETGFTVNASYNREAVNSWFLGGEKVVLDSYGIAVQASPYNGDIITFERISYLKPQEKLMPSIYRETNGEERFYNASNNTYINPQTGDYYEFENPYIDGKPKEHIVNFDDIKPSIVGMVNSNGLRIDMFQEFAYDLNDNDEFDEEGNYLHPYFFGKLRRFDGEYGFNLFDHAIDEEEMVISMTSGNCGACEWIIGVDEETQKNLVQVGDNGELLRDNDGNVRCGREGMPSESPQDVQNDTQNNEVWIALKKDTNTFGVIMPNATNNYRPNKDDTFVILHINLPKAFILAAEDKLKEELIKYMAMNNSEKFNFSITFSRIFFAENPDILAQLNENARIQIEYDNELYELYVSSYSYNMSSDKPLPEIKVELSDTLAVTQNALQTAVSEVKHDIMSSVGSIDFLKQGLKYFIRKDVDDRAKGKISTDKAFEVGEYVAGSSGAIIYKDTSTGQTIGEIDKLYIRMKAYYERLEIINSSSIAGKQIISPAGSNSCVGVEELEDAYRCYFLGEQDGDSIENRWVVGDQAYSQNFNANIGVTNKISNHYYWRLVIGVNDVMVEYNGRKCHYIDLSKTDCDNGSDIPQAGDVINQRGNRTDLGRMNFIEQSSVETFSPSVILYHGVNSYSLKDKQYVSFGVDKITNKAFMNVYGDMYVGDRSQTAYIRYTQEGGLEICGKLAVGTKLGDNDLQELIKSATPEGYQEFVDKVTQDIEGLQQQIDGAIESYFFQYDPSLDNYPAMEWDTENEKIAHLNDTFTNIASDSGRSWRWVVDKETGVYYWTEITDTATTKALALAGKAQDTADGKRRVFVDTPYPPYDKGDLWSRGSDYPLMICVVPKATGVYEEGDFDYADNNAKLREEMQSLVSNTKDELNNAIGQANTSISNLDKDLTQAKKDLQGALDELENAKTDITKIYGWAEEDGIITQAEKNAIKAANEQAIASINLYDALVKAWADGEVTEDEQIKIDGAKASLASAKKYAEEQAKNVQTAIKNSYLFNALKEAPETTIENGLILSSLIQLRNTDNSVKSGINGLIDANKGDKSIANWWGGIMDDMTNYYTWDGSQWIPKSDVTIPSNLPTGLIRMDGTGYLANGKFWWDETGKIYADPTALFLSFDVEAEAGTLSATILDISDKQVEFASMWEIKEDTNKNKYLYSKFPLATQGGITMYAGTEGLDVPSIYDGIPIDGTTIRWENGRLVASIDVEIPEINNDKTYRHEQAVSASIWNIKHNMNKYPSIMVFDSANNQVYGDIMYDSLQELTLTFSVDFTGYAILN